MQYRVVLLPKRYAGQVKTLSGKQMASSTPSTVIIPVGTRIITSLQEDNLSNGYYSGTIAETPNSRNKYR